MNRWKISKFPPHLAKFLPTFKSLINEAYNHNSTEDDRNDSTDTSRNDKKDSVKNLKVIYNKDIYEEYKDENSSDHNSNENVINKTEE